MQTFSSLEAAQLKNTYLSIGSFDGVHRGHQALLGAMIDSARIAGASPAVVTFFPHPRLVLGREGSFRYLATIEDRIALFGKLGLENVIVQPFDLALANTSAHDFLARLQNHLQPASVWVGEGFTLGRGREGDIPFVRAFGQPAGFSLHVIPPLEMEGANVSSSRIRTALAAGDVETAAALLGRRYALAGEVVHGDGRGKLLGTPTANLQPPALSMIPADGIYATRTLVQGEWHGSVTNIGTRPTFVTSHPPISAIETYILDFHQNLYGETMRLEFSRRLRDEVRFEALIDLQEQIKIDITDARRIWEDQR
jgi:riboflavin kinase / FMN adenylyltransferase